MYIYVYIHICINYCPYTGIKYPIKVYLSLNKETRGNYIYIYI